MKTATVMCLLAVVATACSSSPGPAAEGSPSTSSSPSAVASAPTPSVSPRPSARATAALKCRLPITAATSPGEPPGGWITFPGGKFVRDPASATAFTGNHLPSYDRAIGRWVSAEYESVSPDGASYALYNDQTTAVPFGLYVVDARTGKRRLLSSAGVAGSKWHAVLDYASEGLYLAAPGDGMAQPIPGIWLVDPKTDRIRQIESRHVWFKAAGGAAWSIEPWASEAHSYTVYRLDLRTGHVATWYQTKTAIRPLSPTQEGGLMVFYGAVGSYHLAVLTAPKTYVPLRIPAKFDVSSARLARPGVWLSQVDGIALYTKADGVNVVAKSAGYVTGGFGFYNAVGGCW